MLSPTFAVSDDAKRLVVRFVADDGRQMEADIGPVRVVPEPAGSVTVHAEPRHLPGAWRPDVDVDADTGLVVARATHPDRKPKPKNVDHHTEL